MSLYVDIEKRLGDFQLRAEVDTGAGMLALLGASGCGKSMTLQCVAGIVRPDRGRITLDGRTLYDSENGINLPPQKRRVGYLFQQYALFPNMTARQNVAAGARGLPREERRDEVERLWKLLRLEGLEDLRPSQLSGGQQQRVALARILASRPGAILLDEPFSALDSFLKWQLESELVETLRSFGGPVVWVSHDRDEVYRRCRDVCVMDRGRTGPVEDMRWMFQDPETVVAARLSGCKNYTPLEPRGSHVYLPEWGVTLDCGRPVPPGARVLGVRSHFIGPEFAENRFWCRVVEVVESVFSTVVMVVPELAAPDCPAIRLEMEKDTWKRFEEQRRIEIGASPKDLLLLREEASI